MNPKSLAETMFDLQLAIDNCERTDNHVWLAKHRASLFALCKLLPSGSGIDNGTKLVRVRTTPGDELIELQAGFHHMNDQGSYNGWTEHTIRIRPSFSGLNITISGPDRNEIKEYLHDVYFHVMRMRARFDLVTERWLSEFDGVTEQQS
jgi:hypothetical protein